MADLTSAGVSVSRSWSIVLSNGSTMFVKAVTLTLSSQGSAAAGSLIPASALGLTSIEEVSPLVKSDNAEVNPAGPSTDRANILVRASATNTVAAVSGTYSCVVKGY